MFLASLQQKNEKIYDKFWGALMRQSLEQCAGVVEPGPVGGKCEKESAPGDFMLLAKGRTGRCRWKV